MELHSWPADYGDDEVLRPVAVAWLTVAMDFEISDSALDLIRSKGGTAAIDFIDPIA